MEGSGVFEGDFRIERKVKHGRAATGDKEEDEGVFARLLEHGQRGTCGGEGIFIGERMSAFEVAEAPVPLVRQGRAAADAAKSFAALHAVEEDLKHGSGRLAESDEEDAFVLREVNSVRPAAIRHDALENVCFKSDAAIEGRGNITCLDGAGEDFCCFRVQGVQSGVAHGGHGTCSLHQPASAFCIA